MIERSSEIATRPRGGQALQMRKKFADVNPAEYWCRRETHTKRC
jgi:hypothetical protein